MKNKEIEVNLVVFDESRSFVVSFVINFFGVFVKRRGSFIDV